MKLQARMLSMVAFLVLAIPMIAGATPVGTFSSDLGVLTGQATQTFYGDGAIYGNGFLQVPALNVNGDKCLQCHQQGGPAPDKSSYLRTGHGNMVLKVTSPPQAWKGPLGDPYPTTSVGHPINWATGKVNLLGSCDVGGFEGQFEQEACEGPTKRCTLDASNYPAQYTSEADCTKAGGTWKTGKWTAKERLVNIIYLIGPWMSIDAPDTGIAGGDLPPNTFFMADGRTYGTCGSCHTAGYKANDYTRPQPFADYPNFPKSAKAGVGGSWVLDGIQCERCHDATKHYSAADNFFAFAPRNTFSTAVCSQCHIRAGAWEGSANPNASTQPTAYPLGASATNFSSHTIGKQLMNSPHGKFSGAYAQIATRTDLYNSRFSPANDGVSADNSQGGCDTCHDVHQTTIVRIAPEGPGEGDLPLTVAKSGGKPLSTTGTFEPIRRECTACHKDKEDLLALRHPRGAGTPQGDGSNVAGACVICHLPKPGGTPMSDVAPFLSGGIRAHVFRINTDPNYSTFPKAGATTPGICSDPYYKTRAACLAASKSWSTVANSAPDGDWTNAVWVDLGLACGQCHYAGNGAIVLSNKQLSTYAKGMHGTGGNTNKAPIAAITTTSPTVAGLTVTFTDASFDDSTLNPDLVDPKFDLLITVSWGDGTIETGLAGSTFVHTYASPGKKTIRQVATDTGGLKGFNKISVTLQ